MFNHDQTDKMQIFHLEVREVTQGLCLFVGEFSIADIFQTYCM